MAKNKTIVNFILDKSGSMGTVKDATISGFNEYIDTLKKDKKNRYEFTLTLFDTNVTKPVKAEPIDKVPKLNKETYNPDGWTALYDAVCKTIKDVRVSKGDKAIAVIMTDGAENSSKEYTIQTMTKLIKEREKKGNWTFIYLGANQDAYAVGQNFGMAVGNITNFNATARGMGATMVTLANNTMMYAASNLSTTDSYFSKEDQDKLGKTK